MGAGTGRGALEALRRIEAPRLVGALALAIPGAGPPAAVDSAPMTDPAPRSGDVVHRLTSSTSALLLGMQRLRKLAQDGDRERVLALIDRLEGTVQAMVEALEAARAAAPQPPPERDPGSS